MKIRLGHYSLDMKVISPLYFIFSLFLQCVLVTESCLTLCDPMEYRPSSSTVHGILQARILEWLPFSFPVFSIILEKILLCHFLQYWRNSPLHFYNSKLYYFIEAQYILEPIKCKQIFYNGIHSKLFLSSFFVSQTYMKGLH